MLQESQEIVEHIEVYAPSAIKNKEVVVSGVWKLYFDGAYSKEGNGDGVLVLSPKGHIIPFSYKLNFDSTNNITEYEALVLGLQAAKNRITM